MKNVPDILSFTTYEILRLNLNKYSFEVHEIIFLNVDVMFACGIRLGIGKMKVVK